MSGSANDVAADGESAPTDGDPVPTCDPVLGDRKTVADDVDGEPEAGGEQEVEGGEEQEVEPDDGESEKLFDERPVDVRGETAVNPVEEKDVSGLLLSDGNEPATSSAADGVPDKIDDATNNFPVTVTAVTDAIEDRSGNANIRVGLHLIFS